MIHLLPGTAQNVIATKAVEKLTAADYEKLLPVLTNKLEEYEKLRWYFEMEKFTGWESGAFWEDVDFDRKHAHDFERMAMVGEKKWQEWMTGRMQLFSNAAIKFFNPGQSNEAKKWIAENLL